VTGFVAENVTVNVTIPVTMNETTLSSVYGWLVIMSRIDLNFPLNLTSTAYENGFGDIVTNFWLGLARVYQLTNCAQNDACHSYRLRFEFLSAYYNRQDEFFSFIFASM
jgi:hypothetical protein